jgi:hypothetical protein
MDSQWLFVFRSEAIGDDNLCSCSICFFLMIRVHSYHVLFLCMTTCCIHVVIYIMLLFLRTCIIIYIVKHIYIYLLYYITYMREAFPARLGLCIMGQEKRESQWQIHQSQVESSATGASASCHSAGLGWSYDIHCYPMISYDFFIGHLDGDEIQVEQWHGEVVGRCEKSSMRRMKGSSPAVLYSISQHCAIVKGWILYLCWRMITNPWIAGRWFGTSFFFSPYIGNYNALWLSYFSEWWLYHQPDSDLCSYYVWIPSMGWI